MSIRAQITLGIIAIEALLLAILLFNGLHILRNSNERALLDRTQTTTQLFATATQAAVLSMDLASLESLLETLLKNPGIVYARVIGTDITLAEAGTDTALKKTFIKDLSLATAAVDRVFDTDANITVSDHNYGRVEIGFSTEVIEAVVHKAQSTSLIIAFFIGLLSIGFASLIAYLLTRRLAIMQRATQKIVDGALGFQMDVTGKDELTKTMSSFNAMSLRLLELNNAHIEKEQEIAQLNADLEKRVVDRTLRLNELNVQLEHQALHDALTKLPNRNLFHDRLRSAQKTSKRSGYKFAVVSIDLNGFKEINDSLGHHAGDLALKHVANACAMAIRDSDTVARMGGDEFAVLLQNVTDLDNALTVCHRIANYIKEPLEIDGRTLELSGSIGVAIYPEHGDTEMALMNNSDAAMYEAKTKKLGICAFRTDMNVFDSELLTLKSELRRGINNGEIILHFQPKVELDSKTVSGAEALARWQHPRLGLLYPDKFIALAESGGLMRQLTCEVVRQALKQAKRWYQEGLIIPVAVNISTVNLQDNDFPAWIENTLTMLDIPRELLELEVTETSIMTDPTTAIENISKLAEIGVQVSIDDFGTGYSSMAYLQKLLVAKIKIDKGFVIEMGSKERDEIIVRSTIELAHNLGLKAIAEGVEDQTAWNKLKELGCDSAQGYFMSKPVTAEKFVEWAKDANWKIGHDK